MTLIELDDDVAVSTLLKACAEHSLRVDAQLNGRLRISNNFFTSKRAREFSPQAPEAALLVWVDALPDELLRLDDYQLDTAQAG